MTHDPLCPCDGNPPWITVCQCDLIAAIRTDERERTTIIITDRIDGLRSCLKEDDCLMHAWGAELALDDLRESWGRGISSDTVSRESERTDD